MPKQKVPPTPEPPPDWSWLNLLGSLATLAVASITIIIFFLNLSRKIDDLDKKIDELKEIVERSADDMATFRDDMATLGDDVAILRDDVATLKDKRFTVDIGSLISSSESGSGTQLRP